MVRPQLIQDDGTPSGSWILGVFTLVVVGLIIAGVVSETVAENLGRISGFVETTYLGSMAIYLGKKGVIDIGKFKYTRGE